MRTHTYTYSHTKHEHKHLQYNIVIKEPLETTHAPENVPPIQQHLPDSFTNQRVLRFLKDLFEPVHPTIDTRRKEHCESWVHWRS